MLSTHQLREEECPLRIVLALVTGRDAAALAGGLAVRLRAGRAHAWHCGSPPNKGGAQQTILNAS